MSNSIQVQDDGLREREAFTLAPRWFRDTELIFEEEGASYCCFTESELADLLTTERAAAEERGRREAALAVQSMFWNAAEMHVDADNDIWRISKQSFNAIIDPLLASHKEES